MSQTKLNSIQIMNGNWYCTCSSPIKPPKITAARNMSRMQKICESCEGAKSQEIHRLGVMSRFRDKKSD